MDRMRESIFSILGNLDGCSFLDLFSGSGVIGIEAASRGAAPVTMIEADVGKRATIIANLSFVESEVRLHIMPAERYLASARQRFDYVFLDPPFRYPDKPALLEVIDRRRILSGTGRALIHHPREEVLPQIVGRLVRVDTRVYGRSIVDFYELQSSVSDR